MRYDFATRDELDDQANYYRDRYRYLTLEAVRATRSGIDTLPLSKIDAFFVGEC
jgi:hypothetical protein